MALTSINPATGEIIQSFEEQTDTELSAAAVILPEVFLKAVSLAPNLGYPVQN